MNIEMIIPNEPDQITKKRIEENIKFIKNCAGVNPDLLGPSPELPKD